ncbi:hypothetical protein TruAng_003739 [Truncatella angustata]|nr:hypothetical protein TruAng_003739 [Truncatella angustata]
MSIAKTVGGEEAFQNALMIDTLIIKFATQTLEVVRTEFSAQTRLYKAMAYEVDHHSWLSSMMATINLKSSHLLENMIIEKLHRQFCRMENGRLGWLPPVATAGDFICVIEGMELPYAIRPAADGRFLLIGECIIMGLMMGEAMDLPGVNSKIFIHQE